MQRYSQHLVIGGHVSADAELFATPAQAFASAGSGGAGLRWVPVARDTWAAEDPSVADATWVVTGRGPGPLFRVVHETGPGMSRPVGEGFYRDIDAALEAAKWEHERMSMFSLHASEPLRFTQVGQYLIALTQGLTGPTRFRIEQVG